MIMVLKVVVVMYAYLKNSLFLKSKVGGKVHLYNNKRRDRLFQARCPH